jgi:hypothetical protein
MLLEQAFVLIKEVKKREVSRKGRKGRKEEKKVRRLEEQSLSLP